MLRKLLLIFLLICMTNCKHSPSYSVENLYTILDQTSEYFRNLSDAHRASDTVTLDNINNVITKYVENTSEAIRRQKRNLQNNLQSSKARVSALQSFKETLSINLPDFQDVAFVTVQNEQSLLWLAAAIDSSRILLYQLVNNAVQSVGTYPQPDGKRIIANNYNNGILMVVQKDTDEIVVLRLSKNRNGIYELYFKQEFEIPGVSYIDMWVGMNQLYLGIASDTKVFIYVWLEEHFDKIDTLHFGAKKLLPFQSKSFMHIVVTGSFTKILRFSVRSNKFIETQRLSKARDINSFNFRRGHFEEQFLLLASENSTILYKELYNRFVPFQRVTSAESIHSLTMGDTVILLLKKKDTVEIYQYDGWKFLKLHITLSDVRQVHKIRSYSEDILVVQKQNGKLKFLGPIWAVKKTWQSLQDEIHTWCSKTMRKVSQRTLEKIPRLKDPVKILNAYIERLRAQNVNGHNATELIHLTQQYKKIMAKLNLVNNTLTQSINAERSRYIVLYGKKIAVKCKTRCYVRHINTSTEFKPAAKTGKLESLNQALEFTKLKVQTIDNWKCPIPNFDIDDIFVKKSVNGIFMQNLQEETLKIFGDQEISGEHIFSNLRAINVSMPQLDIATYSTKQILLMKEVRVKELYLTEDEFFLPLNGSPITMNGSITAAKVKVTGLVRLKGGIKGKGREKLMPVKNIFAPLTLSGAYFLQNVTFRNLVKAKDIVASHGSSLKGILENSIPLNSNMPQRLILSSNKTHWYNVTLLNYKKWVTKNSAETIAISGIKSTNNNIILTDTTYANLPTLKLTVPLCTTVVITHEIKTSSITVDNVVVKNLNVSHVLGAYNLDNIIFDSVSDLRNIDFATKLFTGQVFVKNISAYEIEEADMQDFKIQMNEWVDINRFKGSVNITKLVVNNLEIPAVFNLPLPKKIKNVIVRADTYIGKINNANISSFMENALKVDNVISLENATFTHGFTSNHIHASGSTLNLSHLDTHTHLHSKRISGTLKTDMINIPQTLGYVASNIPSTFVVQGTVQFVREPNVQNVENINLKQLSENLWISNQDTVLSGTMNVKNITIQANVNIYDPVSSLNTETWLNLSSRLLSKTKQQNITVASSFKNVEVPAIIATNNTIFQSSDFNLNTLLTNSLMRNMAQTVKATWRFKELNIDNLYWDGKLNGIDLNTDIVRYNAEHNIITGRKTIMHLTTENLWSYNKNFSNWANNALTEKRRKLSTIKGRKTFNNITLNNLSIKGTIMGRNVEEALLKSGNQTVFGTKKIGGTFNAPSLITDSTVNDINLMQLIYNQAKKYRLLQTIETEIDFINDIEVFGNIIVDGSYGGTDLINISNRNKLNAILNRMMKVAEFAENVKIALHNPAIYISKFEAVKTIIVSEITLNPDIENVTVLNNTCSCEPKNISSFCNDTKLLNILADTNSSSFIMIKLVLLNDTVFAVIVSSDFVSIYAYTAMGQEFVQKAELYVPDILQVSVEPADNSLWIILRLSEQTLILRYQVWDELEQYVLPASDTFMISTAPNNQSLLIRSDGVWNLEGVFHPRHIFKMPLNGEIETLGFGANYYIKVTTENSTAVFKARYIGN